MQAMQPPYDKSDAQRQHLILTRGGSSLDILFAQHNHSEESAALIREDLTVALPRIPGLREVAGAVAAVLELRMPIPAPLKAVETRILLRIAATAAEEALDLYPEDATRRDLVTLVVYCALIVHGPVGAELPWQDPVLAMRVRHRISRVPSLLDAPERDR